MGKLINDFLHVFSKGKAKPLMFSRQWTHIRDLQKSGKVPQFGSFKYSAAELHKKGVLISVDEYSPKQYESLRTREDYDFFSLTAHQN